MKIGIAITSLGVAGGIKCLLLLASSLRKKGHEVELFWQSHSFKNHLKNLVFPPKITWTEEDYIITPLRSWDHIPKLDVLVAGPWRTAEPALRWSKKYSGKAFYYVQHDESLWDGGEAAAQTYSLPLRKIVISTWLKNLMKEKYGQESLLCVTPVDKELFSISSNHPERVNRILLLHHTFDWKGFDEGLNIVEEALKDHPELRLVVIGGRVENPQLPSHVEYHYQPEQKKIREIYASCGIFLCPSWYEGLGMPSMEAMATGALLVTTDTGGSQDFASHNETALVSPSRDTESLLRNLKYAIKNWNSLSTMRLAGQAKVRQFQWDVNVDKIEAEFKSR